MQRQRRKENNTKFSSRWRDSKDGRRK